MQLHNTLKLLANPPAAPGHGVQVCRATAASLRAGGAVLGRFAQMLMLVTDGGTAALGPHCPHGDESREGYGRNVVSVLF